jgi:hypothetical protein
MKNLGIFENYKSSREKLIGGSESRFLPQECTQTITYTRVYNLRI